MEQSGDDGVTYRQLMRRANPMWSYGREIMARVRDAEGSRAAARVLLETYGKACLLHSGIVGHPVGDDRAEWIQLVILGPVGMRYVHAGISLAEDDQAELERMTDSVIEFATRSKLTALTQLPVAGLRITAPIESSGVRIRPITAEELNDLGVAEILDYSGRRTVFGRMGDRMFVDESAVIEAREPRDKDRQDPGTPDLLRRTLLALQLLGFDPFGRGYAVTTYEPIPLVGLRGMPMRLPERGTWRTVTPADLDEVLGLTEVLATVPTEPSSPQAIALTRFASAAAKQSHADALLDYTIALEVVLLRGARAELSFRFRLLGAWLLGLDGAERTEYAKRFQRVYEFRSQVVHGGAASAEIEAVAKDARALASAVLLKALRDGWPDGATLARLALG